MNFKNPSKGDTNLVESAITKAIEVITLEKPFLLILDEINVALLFKMTTNEKVLELLELAKRNKVHLILTGRGATKEIIKQADLVTEMKAIKHLYENGKGQKATEGLEY